MGVDDGECDELSGVGYLSKWFCVWVWNGLVIYPFLVFLRRTNVCVECYMPGERVGDVCWLWIMLKFTGTSADNVSSVFIQSDYLIKYMKLVAESICFIEKVTAKQTERTL